MEATSASSRPAYRYRTLWVWLLLGWTVSYADRTVTGPVVSYMIDNDISFVQGVESPFSLGGLIGSLFFAGYMLTQFPGGYLGDRFGHRTMVVVSVVWAGIATILSGLMTALIGFVALRVITGLGEGTLYSNDRSVITEQTPPEKRSFGMGVVITGLSIGLTLAFILTPPLIGLGASVFGTEGAWRMPFFVLGAVTLVVGFGMHVFFKGQGGGPDPLQQGSVLDLHSLHRHSLAPLVLRFLGSLHSLGRLWRGIFLKGSADGRVLRRGGHQWGPRRRPARP